VKFLPLKKSLFTKATRLRMLKRDNIVASKKNEKPIIKSVWTRPSLI